MIILYTLDSHDCFGPFETEQAAHDWAKRTSHKSYQLLTKLPFPRTDILRRPH